MDMNIYFRILSGILLAIIIAVIAVQEQLGALLPATWAIAFTLVIIIFREIVKAYGSKLEDITMNPKYRFVSALMLAFAVALVSLESTLTASFPQYSTIIAVVVIIAREAIKDKGLTTTNTEPTVIETVTVEPEPTVSEEEGNPEEEV